MADSSTVTFPPEVAEQWIAAIRSIKVAVAGLQEWADQQPPPVKLVAGRVIRWWRQAILITEPLIITVEKS